MVYLCLKKDQFLVDHNKINCRCISTEIIAVVNHQVIDVIARKTLSVSQPSPCKEASLLTSRCSSPASLSVVLSASAGNNSRR